VCRSGTACLLIGLAVGANACATAARNPVLDSYPVGVSGRTTVEYYDVHGSTFAELRADMRRLGPKINGGSFVGETRSPMRWSWRTKPVGTGSCSIEDIRVSMNAQILLPRWTPPAGADSALVREWKRFIEALEVHEAGHKDISARAGREIVEQLRGMSGPCSQVGTRANDAARRIFDRARDEQARYDAETRHGLTQGTTFGPPRVLTAAGDGRPAASPIDLPSLPASQRQAMEASRARADSAAARVTKLLVVPRSLELSVGDSVFSLDLYRRLELAGVTAEGDTLRSFARTYLLEPGTSLVRAGNELVARHEGDANLWILLGSRPQVQLRESARVVRVPIHIR